ncbi:MAG: antibiotic biosynthesis monooxygenase [Candidatus Sulfotelmatobacter sp.]
MSEQTVQFNVRLTVNDGRFDAFEEIARTMIAGTLKEPGALGYEWYLSRDRRRCHLIEDYKNASAVQAHIESAVVRNLVPKLLEVSTIDSFHVYGDPGPKAAEALTGMGAEILPFWQGLGR